MHSWIMGAINVPFREEKSSSKSFFPSQFPVFMRLHLYTSTLDMFMFANDSDENYLKLFSCCLTIRGRELIISVCVCDFSTAARHAAAADQGQQGADVGRPR